VKIDNSKQANQHDNVRTKQSLAAQNNLDDNFHTDKGDAPFGNFAGIFESVVNRDKEKDSDTDSSTKESKLEGKDKDDSSKDHKRVSEKKDSDDSDSSSGNGEANAGSAAWRMNNNTQMPVANLENINARAILHIADIEKIVSSIRTQLSDVNMPQVVIQLKNSVLDGLQIKLSTDANGKVIAEFVSKSEKARLQIESKTRELADILNNRGIQLSSIKTSLADASADNGNNQNQQAFNEMPKIKTTAVASEKQNAETEEVSQVSTSNSYRA
jgi:uncharacterized protein YlaN (UPF0358 family)